jgi:hypothetical protein
MKRFLLIGAPLIAMLIAGYLVGTHLRRQDNRKAFHATPRPSMERRPVVDSNPPDNYTSKNKLYIVPAGVHNAAEFRSRPDRVARELYAGIQAASLKPARNTGNYYLSYRRGNVVYWTRAAHHLQAEPVLVSNNQAVIRQRCGNLLSAAPRMPTEPTSLQPTEQELGSPNPEFLASNEPPAYLDFGGTPGVELLPNLDPYLPDTADQPVRTGARGDGEPDHSATNQAFASGFNSGAAPFFGGGFPYPALRNPSGSNDGSGTGGNGSTGNGTGGNGGSSNGGNGGSGGNGNSNPPTAVTPEPASFGFVFAAFALLGFARVAASRRKATQRA